MKVSLTVLLIFSILAPAFGQDEKKIAADNVRSFNRVVKGAPFSAEAISESVQTLADGNQISRQTVSHLYRDSEGRFRREDMPKQLGVAGAVVDVPESVVITDPVAGVRFNLNLKNQTFRQFNFREPFELKQRNELFKLKTEQFKLKNEEFKLNQQMVKDGLAQKKAAASPTKPIDENERARREEQRAIRAKQAEIRKEQAAERKAQIAERIAETVERDSEKEITRKSDEQTIEKNYDTKNESLGTQTIEGVNAEGKRTTTTIPAGAVGNAMPIEIVYERWYSPELQLTVQSRHSDPRFGVQTYRLTNIRREEPPASLFSPPANFKQAGDKMMKPVPTNPPKPPPPGKAAPAKPAAPTESKKTLSANSKITCPNHA
ncbi:MAG TPA: hypothetical protein VHL50_02150 [Pyrinomonadaceae bacterium]|jgi:hypothetical protein|nr:hypothetical protein [Pyrinomonadaceae bacterium]